MKANTTLNRRVESAMLQRENSTKCYFEWAAPRLHDLNRRGLFPVRFPLSAIAKGLDTATTFEVLSSKCSSPCDADRI